MSLPPVLSPKAVVKFRTKICERVLSFGHCSFGDRCQFSHDPSWPRRHPGRIRYAPKLCRQATCSQGRMCSFAHTEEELRYHPEVYKTLPCQDGAACLSFYCPFVHSEHERECARGVLAEDFQDRDAPLTVEAPTATQAAAGRATLSDTADQAAGNEKRRGRRGGRRHRTRDDKEDAPTQAAPPEIEQPLWDASDCLRVAIIPEADCPGSQASQSTGTAGASSSDGAGAALLGGRVLPGWARQGKSKELAHQPCMVKLVPVGSEDRKTACLVLAQVKRWMGRATSQRRCLAVRKTKATICLAFDAMPATLDNVLAAMGECLSLQMQQDANINGVAASWIQQLVASVSELHSMFGAGHLCISPCTVHVGRDGNLELGDFLGKVRVLQHVMPGSHCLSADHCLDPRWKMWYPVEVQKRHADSTEEHPELDELRVDAWQLGVTIFYMLTREHPFGDSRSDPWAVCQNICNGMPVNMKLLDALPAFADLVSGLIATDPKQRPLPASLELHPALPWLPTPDANILLTVPDEFAPAEYLGDATVELSWMRPPWMALPSACTLTEASAGRELGMTIDCPALSATSTFEDCADHIAIFSPHAHLADASWHSQWPLANADPYLLTFMSSFGQALAAAHIAALESVQSAAAGASRADSHRIESSPHSTFVDESMAAFDAAGDYMVSHEDSQPELFELELPSYVSCVEDNPRDDQDIAATDALLDAQLGRLHKQLQGLLADLRAVALWKLE